MTTSITNEYTSLQKYKSLSLHFRKGDILLCVRDEWKQGTDCYFDPSSSLDHSSTSFAFWLGLLCCILTFDPVQNAIQGDAPEGSDTFQWQLGEEIAWAEIV